MVVATESAIRSTASSETASVRCRRGRTADISGEMQSPGRHLLQPLHAKGRIKHLRLMVLERAISQPLQCSAGLGSTDTSLPGAPNGLLCGFGIPRRDPGLLLRTACNMERRQSAPLIFTAPVAEADQLDTASVCSKLCNSTKSAVVRIHTGRASGQSEQMHLDLSLAGIKIHSR